MRLMALYKCFTNLLTCPTCRWLIIFVSSRSWCRQSVVNRHALTWTRWLTCWWHWITITAPCFSRVWKRLRHATAFRRRASYEMTSSSLLAEFLRKYCTLLLLVKPTHLAQLWPLFTTTCATFQKIHKKSRFLDFQKKQTHALRDKLSEQSLTVQINNYTLACGNGSGHAWVTGKVGTDLLNSTFIVLITHQSRGLISKDWGLNSY